MTEAIRLLAQEKGLSEDALLHVLVDALASAYKRRPGAADEVVVEVSPQTMEFTFTAYDLDEDGNWINERDDTPKREELGRIAAQTFRQVMSQRIREVERDRKFEEYANREGDIVTGIIQQTDSRYTLLDLGRVEALLPQAEQVPFERPQPGDRSKAYIVEVRKTAKGPQIVVSRTHPGLIKRLFELEVPEIADGIVEIKACAREPGHRTKIAVWSNDHNVDPVGACVGARGARVRMVVNELRGEKIDIVPFSEDLPDFVAKALSPAKVNQVNISDDRTQADVIVPDHQLSLAIGREGQNARLAARLTGVRVDIRSETQVAEGVPAGGIVDDVEYAEGEWVTNAETGDMEWHAADGSVISQAEWAAAIRIGHGASRSSAADGDRSDAERRQPIDTAQPVGDDSRSRRRRQPVTPLSRRRSRRGGRTGREDAEACWRRRRAGRGRRSCPATTPNPLTRRKVLATTTERHRAIRTCIGCRRLSERDAMLRCVLGSDGQVHVGPTAPGRGAWLCGPDCLPSAISRRAFDRAWRRQIPALAIESLVRELEAMDSRPESVESR